MTTSPTGTRILLNKGFTLIELAFVAVLWVLLLTLAAPRFSRAYKGSAERNSVEDIRMLFSLARDRAILEGVRYGVRFSAGEKTYELVRQEADRFSGNWERVSEKGGHRRSLPAGLSFREDATAVFYPNGRSSALSLDLLTVRGPGYTIRLDPVLGKGTVLDPAS